MKFGFGVSSALKIHLITHYHDVFEVNFAKNQALKFYLIIDAEEDNVVFSTDEELREAMNTVQGDVIRIYLIGKHLIEIFN